MGNVPRKADGRRVFNPDFKQATVQRILTGEKTVAELSRELDIAPSVIRNWKRHYEAGAASAFSRQNPMSISRNIVVAVGRKIRIYPPILGTCSLVMDSPAA